jgi:tRNA(fMet)-specific endonuclease VapC
MSSARRFMLDTDTVSFVLRGQGAAGTNLTSHAPSEICLSAISLAELRFGADKRRSKRLHGLIETFIATVEVVPFDVAASAAFGRLCAALELRGAPIGVIDTLIAAHALSLGLTLVTGNTKHFARIRELKTVNWLQDAG